MAIDSAEKRRSAAGAGAYLYGGGPGVTPNAAKDIEWRVQSGWSYSGISGFSAPAAERDAGKDAGSGKRPWYEDIAWEEPVEPLREELEQVREVVAEARSEGISTRDLSARMGSITRSIAKLDQQIKRADTLMQAEAAVQRARTLAARIDKVRAEIDRRAHRRRLEREDEEIMTILAEVL